MKKIVTIAFILLMVVQAFAQKEFKIAKSSGKLILNNTPNLSVEGYEGKEIIIYATGKDEKINDPRAAGLSALNKFGFDNTGIGLSIKEKDNNIIVLPIAKELSLRVKLPHSVALSIKTSGLNQGDSSIITLSNIQSEIDASTQYENFSLKNVSGPVSLKTLYGNIEGKLIPSFKGPISLVSVYGFIDVTVPENAKADISINTQYETLYAAKDLKLVMDEPVVKDNTYALGSGSLTTTGKAPGQNVQVITVTGNSSASPGTPTKAKAPSTTTTKTEATSTIPGLAVVTGSDKLTTSPTKTVTGDITYSYTTNANSSFSYSSNWSNTLNGKLNGGGEKIILKSTYGKIYLRK